MLKNALVLLTGAGSSQLILLFASPIIARIFSPTEYGSFGVFVAVASVLSAIAAGTYDQAIVLARQSKWAINLLALSVVLIIFSASFVLIILYIIFHFKNSSPISYEIDFIYIYLPAALFAGCFNSIMIQWFLRECDYRLISIARILQSVFTVGFQVGVPILFAAKSDILVYGYILGLIVTSIFMGLNVIPIFYKNKYVVSVKSMTLVMMRFSDFPRYMVIGQFANVLSSSLPTILLGLLYGVEIAGFYALAQRVLSAPTMLLVNAFGELYKTESAKIYHLYGNCIDIFLKSARNLALYAAIPALVFFFFGEIIFLGVFGDNWRNAGSISSFLAILLYFQCISTPLATTILLGNLQRYDMWWQVARVFCCVGGIFGGYFFYESYFASIIIHSVFLSLLYIMHFLAQFQIASGLIKSSQMKE